MRMRVSPNLWSLAVNLTGVYLNLRSALRIAELMYGRMNMHWTRLQLPKLETYVYLTARNRFLFSFDNSSIERNTQYIHYRPICEDFIIKNIAKSFLGNQ